MQAGGEFGGSTERSPVVLRGLGFSALFTVPSTLCQLAWAILGNSGLRKATLFMFLLRATLTDLDTGEVAFSTRKTGRRIVLPLVQPLADYLASLPASDNPNAFIFPNSAKHKRTASLSNQFREILVAAGLLEPRTHEATKQGRSHAREASEISFHSLRHSAVTMLKAAGVSDFIAREIVGHDSAAVSRQYTHLTTGDKRNAMQRLPDVTNG